VLEICRTACACSCFATFSRTEERYVREWLASQAAGGYITYNAETHKFGMTEEQMSYTFKLRHYRCFRLDNTGIRYTVLIRASYAFSSFRSSELRQSI